MRKYLFKVYLIDATVEGDKFSNLIRSDKARRRETIVFSSFRRSVPGDCEPTPATSEYNWGRLFLSQEGASSRQSKKFLNLNWGEFLR
jgi:hypothetical protein